GLQSITRVGTVVGSLYYVSPEQLLGHTLDGRTDVYALGVSLYEMVTGQRPYRGQSLTEMSKMILAGTALPPSQLEPLVTPELERIITKALARSLDQRYARAADLCADLRALQAAEAQKAPAQTTSDAEQRPAAPSSMQGAFQGPRAHRLLRPTTLEPAPVQPPGPRTSRPAQSTEPAHHTTPP